MNRLLVLKIAKFSLHSSLLCLAVFASSPAFAVSCLHGSIRDSFNKADMVVIGKVVEIQNAVPENKVPYKAAVASIEIERLLKGEQQGQGAIHVDLMATYNAPNLLTDVKYVLFLDREKDSKTYRLAECSIYFEVKKSMEDYHELLTITK